MSKIITLDRAIANRISAGEVVEKPASVVKELIENSIDAGATEISVDIAEGGIKNITITDNGTGILREDLFKAFLPHSTSKIKSVEDLEKIDTLGFRGEALASISAVSQINIFTKTKDEVVGSRLEIEGENFGKIEDIATNVGTKIEINNLFFNTPARRKFLRKPKTEEGEITHLIEKFLLANPYLKIKYVVDGKVLYNTMGSGLFDNIYTIYGKEISDNLLEVKMKNNKFSLTGYVGKPQVAKPNRTYQTLLVNGRIVTNFLISNSIAKAYENYLMKGKFPFFILNLEIPFFDVDVNVHPSKQEVKFENQSAIYSFFLNSISEVLLSADYIQEIFEKDENINLIKQEQKVDLSNLPTKGTDDIVIKSMMDKIDKNDSDFLFCKKKQSINSLNSKINYTNETISPAPKSNSKIETTLQKNNHNDRLDNEKKNALLSTATEQKVIEINLPTAKIIGTVFKTFILVEANDNIYFIDQHAAHERKNFDTYMGNILNRNIGTQILLLPYTFLCNTLETQFFLDNIENFKTLGFDIETFGDKSFRVLQVPFLLSNINLENFVNEIKSNLLNFNKTTEDLLKEKIAQTACKHSVKAGDILSIDEIGKLISDLNNNAVLLCPHGRPIIIKVSHTQLDKWFKRIV